MNPLILKLGSSVLRDEEALHDAVDAVYAHVRQGTRVLVVVSALGGTTDRLWAQAHAWSDPPRAEALAALVATGEATAVAMLSLALDRAGVPALPVDPGLLVTGDPLSADPVCVDVPRLRDALDRAPVVVVAGFVGRSADGAPAQLGRGGSDLSAVFLAHQLGGRCLLVKDVNGVYDRPPGTPGARRFTELRWDTALALNAPVVQDRALRFGRDHGFAFDVGAATGEATRLGAPADRAERVPRRARPVRVALLGLGTVGGGVLARLRAAPDRYEVVVAAARRTDRHEGLRVVSDPRVAVEADVDVVIEALGGLEPATTAIRRALSRGVPVVTANKAVIAVHGPELEALARRRGTTLACSAAVGGAVPALEAAARFAGRVEGVEGVLNGTTNFVLDQLAAGIGWEEALSRARQRGLCEADPWADLDGADAARKLVLLARRAFGAEVAVSVTPWRDPRGAIGIVRQVARLRWEAGELVATVGPEELDAAHPLAQVRGEDNALVLHTTEGPVILRGKGAGRWPTTSAVLADLRGLGGVA